MWASLLIAATAAASSPDAVHNDGLATIPFFHTLGAADGLP
jgi:hypothetical protein